MRVTVALLGWLLEIDFGPDDGGPAPPVSGQFELGFAPPNHEDT